MTPATAIQAATGMVSVIRVSGELGAVEMDSLAQALTDLLLEKKRQVVLNFKSVTHVSLGGVAKLAEKNRKFRAVNGEIKLVGMNPYVTNLFHLVGAHSSFDVTSSEDEAVSRFEY